MPLKVNAYRQSIARNGIADWKYGLPMSRSAFGQLRCALVASTYTPDESHSSFTWDVAPHEIAAVGGYISGGAYPVCSIGFPFRSTAAIWLRNGIFEWGSLAATFRTAVIYCPVTYSDPNNFSIQHFKPLIAYVTWPSDVTVNTTFPFRLHFDFDGGTTGLFGVS